MPWPNIEQSFAFRYFHERNLYQVTRNNKKQIKRFAQALQSRLHVQADSAQAIIIRQRCKQLVSDISVLWGEKGCGFLVKSSTGLVKAPQFENAWKFHRNSWIFRVHGGITDGVIELNVPSPTGKQENPSKKRVCDLSSRSPLSPHADHC